MRNEHLCVRCRACFCSYVISLNPSHKLKIFAKAFFGPFSPPSLPSLCPPSLPLFLPSFLSFFYFSSFLSFNKCLQSLLWICSCSRHKEYSSEQKKILTFTEHIFFWVWVEQTINKQVNMNYTKWHSMQRRNIKQSNATGEVGGAV